jgi:Flp pilus assembly protein TadG
MGRLLRKLCVATRHIWCNKMAKRLLAQLIKSQSGVAGVEMALMTPLLMALMFGSFELGNYFWSEQKVIKGVRDASRFAGRQPFEKFSCSSVNDTALETQIKNLARTGKTSGGTSKILGWTDTQVTIVVSCNATMTTGIYTGMTGGARVVTVVATDVPYPSLFGILGFDASAITLNASSRSPVMGI